MRRNTLALALLLVCLGLFAGGHSAAQSPINIYVGGGLAIPDKPGLFDSYFQEGYHLMGGLGMSVMPFIESVGKVEYFKFSENMTELDNGDIEIILYGIDGKLNLSFPFLPFKPYGLAGIGLANVKKERFEIPDYIEDEQILTLIEAMEVEEQTKFYFNLGIGAQYSLFPAIDLFVQARYLQIATTGEPPVVFDKDIRIWSISGGVKVL